MGGSDSPAQLSDLPRGETGEREGHRANEDRVMHALSGDKVSGYRVNRLSISGYRVHVPLLGFQCEV